MPAFIFILLFSSAYVFSLVANLIASPFNGLLAEEVEIYQSGWLAQMAHRVPQSLEMETTSLFFWGFWRAGGLMLIGMALFQMGVLTAQRSTTYYRNMLIVGFALGFPLIVYGLVTNFDSGWSVEYARFTGSLFNYWGSISISLGYIAAIMLIAISA